jgi:hypothetical protein
MRALMDDIDVLVTNEGTTVTLVFGLVEHHVPA